VLAGYAAAACGPGASTRRPWPLAHPPLLTSHRSLDLASFDGPHCARLPRLQLLSLSHNALTSLSGVGALSALVSLNINHNRICSLEALASCPHLGRSWVMVMRLVGGLLCSLQPLHSSPLLCRRAQRHCPSQIVVQGMLCAAQLSSQLLSALHPQLVSDEPSFSAPPSPPTCHSHTHTPPRHTAELFAACNSIRDITPLRGLRSLTTLHLFKNALASLDECMQVGGRSCCSAHQLTSHSRRIPCRCLMSPDMQLCAITSSASPTTLQAGACWPPPPGP